MKNIKITLWKVKEFIKRLFIYPTSSLNPEGDIAHDFYWQERKDRRNTEVFSPLNSWQRKRADMAIEIIKETKGESLADVGGGPGNIAIAIKERTDLKRITVYDGSELALEAAKERGLNTKKIDVSNLKEVSTLESEDYFVLFETIEHVNNSEQVVNILYKKAKIGVFISVPNTGYLSHRLRLLFGKFPLQWQSYPNQHLRFWTLSDMKWWLKAQGYTNYVIHSYEGVPILNKIWPALFAGGIFVYLPKN